jgi:hypothetical protein
MIARDEFWHVVEAYGAQIRPAQIVFYIAAIAAHPPSFCCAAFPWTDELRSIRHSATIVSDASGESTP